MCLPSVVEMYQSHCRKALLHPRAIFYPVLEEACQSGIFDIRQQGYGVALLYPALKCFVSYRALYKLNLARCGLSKRRNAKKRNL
jgi:hypothetical protein